MKVIGCNTRRFKKQLDTPNEEGMPVTCKEFDNQREEYMCVVAALKKRMERGEDLLNTAILLRTNQESEGLINVLMEYQVCLLYTSAPKHNCFPCVPFHNKLF